MSPEPSPSRAPSSSLVACLDVGSTWTKLAVVDTATGTLVATDAHPTTARTDVLDGVDTLLGRAGPVGSVRCCSSAGGGLRLAVVGYEALVSAEAGHRVALCAGARVVHLAAGPLTAAAVTDLTRTRPDVVLLVGGTDGGDTDVIVHNAHRLATARLRVPVVVAGNTDARDTAVAALAAGHVPATATANVLPRIGVVDSAPARAAIRDVFLRHVIGGKHLSRGPRFARLVRAATPDAVYTAVEVLADTLGRALLVVDVGGATTDVYSALVPTDDDRADPAGTVRRARADVAGTLWRARTVEGDLGVTWSADSTDTAAAQEKLDPPPALDDPDLRRAALATTIAVRRHTRTGRDLRDVRLVVASGGVYRHAPPGSARAALDLTLHDHAGGWALPPAPRVVVDTGYVLAPAGLLAADHPDVAAALLRRHLLD